MNNEIQEKIKKAANNYSMNYRRTTKSTWCSFVDGATFMYSELAPLVEWVSVEDKLPNSKERVIVKFYTKWSKNSPKKDGCIGIASYDSEKKFWHTLLNDFKQESVTHWRKIEL